MKRLGEQGLQAIKQASDTANEIEVGVGNSLRTINEFDMFAEGWLTRRDQFLARVHPETWRRILVTDILIDHVDGKVVIHRTPFEIDKSVPIGAIRLDNGYMNVDILLAPHRCGECGRWIDDPKEFGSGVVSICPTCAPKLRPGMYPLQEVKP